MLCQQPNKKVDVQQVSKKRKREENHPTSGLGAYITENPKQYEDPEPAKDNEEVVIDKDLGRTLRVCKAWACSFKLHGCKCRIPSNSDG